ncbi:MAG: LuxR C-terminal-related transcriptional regulator [Melioribacteraceae bacterium]|nr:LuxR C-terminal-related transcriptional regulator [Melioribacteraceae bacterium]
MDRLSTREKEVFDLIGEGKGNKEISEAIYISRSTVKVHKKNIIKKLKLNSTKELERLAYENQKKGGRKNTPKG